MPPGAGETISYQILSSVSRTVLDCADKRTVMRGCANSRGGLTLRPDLNDRFWPIAAVGLDVHSTAGNDPKRTSSFLTTLSVGHTILWAITELEQQSDGSNGGEPR